MADALFLDGGPRAGRLVALHGPTPPVYRVAVPPSNLYEVLLAEPFAGDRLEPLTFGNYTPMHDPLGAVYRTAHGQPIYRWRGAE